MRADFAISDTNARTTTLFDVVTCCPTHHNSSSNLCRNAATHPREATAVGPTETTTAPACQNFTIGAHAILAHQDILGGWRVGLSNSSPVLNSEDEQGRAPD